MSKVKNTDHRVHTRRIDRGVARKAMKMMNCRRVVQSGYFAKVWREYAYALEGGDSHGDIE